MAIQTVCLASSKKLHKFPTKIWNFHEKQVALGKYIEQIKTLFANKEN